MLVTISSAGTPDAFIRNESLRTFGECAKRLGMWSEKANDSVSECIRELHCTQRASVYYSAAKRISFHIKTRIGRKWKPCAPKAFEHLTRTDMTIYDHIWPFSTQHDGPETIEHRQNLDQGTAASMQILGSRSMRHMINNDTMILWWRLMMYCIWYSLKLEWIIASQQNVQEGLMKTA